MATIDHRVAPISTIRLPEGGNFALSMTFTGATLTDTSGTVTAQNGESTKRVPLLWSKAGYTPSGSVYSFNIAPATTDDDTVAFSVVTSSGYTDYAFTIYDESGSAPYPIYLRLQGRVEWVPDVGEFEAETEASTAVTVTVDGVEIAVAVTVAGGGSGAVSDGDKGDITVSSSGTVWTIDDSAVSLAKMANLAESRVIGRATGAGTGVPTALTPAQARQVLDIAGEIQTHNLETVGPHGITTYSATIIAANSSAEARTAIGVTAFDPASPGTIGGTTPGNATFGDVLIDGTNAFTTPMLQIGGATTGFATIDGTSRIDVILSGSQVMTYGSANINFYINANVSSVGFDVFAGTQSVTLRQASSGILELINNVGAGLHRDLKLRGIIYVPIAISDLPAAASSEGWRYEVNDANAPSVGATVASGGSAKCEVRSNGTDWKVLQVF